MTWRFLVDEDTDTASADELLDRGYDVVTVATALGKGKPDSQVAEFARSENRILVTTDRDLLDPELHAGIRVLLVISGAATGDEIAERIAELVRLADGPDDLKPVTWIYSSDCDCLLIRSHVVVRSCV